ncbi:Copia protein [Sesamum angolense]|uniref:Copia protein n=1 Tax=Sesamum angolense TaxID=2727404 RepID=A0AAE2BZL4_9LAMI|nr:Copia protein [Sesamum angolense]
MIRSMMSFTKLPLSFWGYALETAARLLNIGPSKTVAQTPYQIWHGKPVSYKYLRVCGSPAYVKRLVGDKLDSRSSLCRFIGYLKETTGYYFYNPSEQKVFVSRNVVFLERGFPTDTQRDQLLFEESSEAPQSNAGTSSVPTISTDNVPILRKWLEAMKSKIDSMSSNQVWTLVDRPKGVRPVGCKWVYKRKIGADAEVTTFKARLVAKGYTQRPRVNFEETFSPLFMAKSIRIKLAIAAWYDYEIWQMDVKTAFLNGFVKEEIYMDQLEGFTVVGEEQKVCHLQRSIYGLKQASRSWNIRFDEVIRGYDFVKNDFDLCVYKKNLGEVSYILGIKIFKDRSKRILGMTQNSYVEKVLKMFKMEHSKRGFLLMKHGVKLSKKQSPKIDEELKRMLDIPYASAVGSIQYAAQCTRPDIA